MKKLLNTSILAAAICLLFQGMVFAQNDVKLGVGIAYDSEVESAGIQANAVFRVTPKIALVPNITLFFPDDDETGIDNYMSFNVDGHYLIEANSEFLVYGLAGLNLTSIEVIEESETELGINIGLGGEYHLNSFSLFGDLKYVIGDLDRIVLAVGARFPI